MLTQMPFVPPPLHVLCPQSHGGTAMPVGLVSGAPASPASAANGVISDTAGVHVRVHDRTWVREVRGGIGG